MPCGFLYIFSEISKCSAEGFACVDKAVSGNFIIICTVMSDLESKGKLAFRAKIKESAERRSFVFIPSCIRRHIVLHLVCHGFAAAVFLK